MRRRTESRLRANLAFALATGLALAVATPPGKAGAQLATRMTRAHRAQAAKGDSLIRAGAFAEAVVELRALREKNPANIYGIWRLGLAERLSGDCESARASYEALTDTPEYALMSSYWVAVAYACLGNQAQAIRWLRRAADLGYASVEFSHGDLVQLRSQGEFDPLRDDPAFQDLVDGIALKPPPDVMRDLAWSPDGKEIVFSGALNGEGNFDLWAVAVDGSRLRRITRTLDSDQGPSWFPDGSRILFSRTRVTPPGRTELRVVARDGTRETRLRPESGVEGDMWQPRYAPDGSSILFVARVAGVSQVFRMSLDGARVTQLTSGPGNKGNPSLNAGGTLLYDVPGPSDEYLIQALEPGETAPRTILDSAWWIRPRWSPEGDEILVNYFDTGMAQLSHLALSRKDGTDAALLLGDTVGTSAGTWSPDGSRIAFVRYRQAHTRGGTELWVVGRNGEGLRRLLPEAGSDPVSGVRPGRLR